MDLTILFQLTFTFIYGTFSKKISVLAKYVDPKQTLSIVNFFYDLIQHTPNLKVAQKRFMRNQLWSLFKHGIACEVQA